MLFAQEFRALTLDHHIHPLSNLHKLPSASRDLHFWTASREISESNSFPQRAQRTRMAGVALARSVKSAGLPSMTPLADH
jgi:hypothetical protein